MCKAPINLPNGVQAACRRCSLCRDRAINDWVGRNIAESKTAKASHAVTLTYGRNRVGDVDHERAALLTYSDVQKYLKLLRRHGLPVRYFVTGEYGSEKGRAHWHIMLYWLDCDPTERSAATKELRERLFPGGEVWFTNPHTKRRWRAEWLPGQIPLDGQWMDEAHWPHGWSQWTEPTAHAIRYNCKYIQKDIGDAERQGHLAMSKKPPLGTSYFRQLAEQYVRQGIAPQSLHYTFPEVRRNKRDGSQETVPFMLKGRSADLFLEHYVATWEATYPGRHMPNSDLLDEFLDPGAWKERQDTDRPFTPPDQPKHQARPMDRDDWWYFYVNGAKNEQERQRRQAERDRHDQADFDRQYNEYKAEFERQRDQAKLDPDQADHDDDSGGDGQES